MRKIAFNVAGASGGAGNKKNVAARENEKCGKRHVDTGRGDRDALGARKESGQRETETTEGTLLSF